MHKINHSLWPGQEVSGEPGVGKRLYKRPTEIVLEVRKLSEGGVLVRVLQRSLITVAQI